MSIGFLSVTVIKVFGKEITDLTLQSFAGFTFFFAFISIALVALSHLFVGKEKAAAKGPFGGSWINRLSIKNVCFPFSALTPLGKKLRIFGKGGILITILMCGIIWFLAK